MKNRDLYLLAGIIVVVVAVVGILRPSPRDLPPDAAPEITASIAGSDLAQAAIPLDAPDPIPITVYLSPTCGCCEGWVEHMVKEGFEVSLEYRENMTATKEEFGVRPEHSSCHTAIVNGYIVEGHVPGDVVRRFLAEAPAVRGLTAPGMPIGSPGMEAGDAVEPYDVLTFTSEGRTQVYAREGRN